MTRVFLAPVLTVTVFATAIAGCSTDSSTGVATSNIEPDFDVTVDTFAGGSTFISAILGEADSDTTKVHLDDPDTITASTDKDGFLKLDYDSTIQIYSTTLDKVTDRKTVNFALNRASGGALESTVTLPPAVTLTAPAMMGTIPYGDGSGMATFSWSNQLPDATMTITAFPSCDDGAVQLQTTSTHGPDTGSIAVPISSLVSSKPPAAGQCLTIRVVRAVKGAIDAALSQNGTFTGQRYDYIKVVVMPSP